MEKLKKLFPLSFKYCKDVKSMVLGTFLLLALELAATLVISFLVEPTISSILHLVLSPIWLFFWIIGIVVLVLGIALVSIFVGIPLIYIGVIILLIPTIIIAWICSFLYSFVSMYVVASVVIMLLAYGGVFGEIQFEEKPKKEKEAETVATAEIAETTAAPAAPEAPETTPDSAE